MPITQDRMMALLRAAQDYQNAIAQITNGIAAQSHSITYGDRTLEEAWELLKISVNPVLLLTEPIQSNQTILAEGLHFKSKHAFNIRKAQKMKENREAARYGEIITRPTTAPKRIDQPVQFGPAQTIAGKIQTFSDPNIIRKYTNTDGQQIQSNSELNFDHSKISIETKTETEQFLQSLEDKEQYEKSREKTTPKADGANEMKY